MYNPYYVMPSSLHPNAGSTKLAIIVVIVMAFLAVAVMLFGTGSSLIKQNISTHNTVNTPSSGGGGGSILDKIGGFFKSIF